MQPSHSRPSSSASTRPSSPASIRPISSASAHRPFSSRPPTSASSRRPLSSLSTRPHSRYGQRAKQSKLMPSCHALVAQLTGITDEDTLKAKVDYVVKHVDPSSATTRAGPSLNLQAVERHVRGHIQRAKINVRDEWAEALEHSYNSLKHRVEKNVDLDDTMRVDRLPDHLQLLLLLANPPAPSTLAYASALLDRLRNPAAQAQGLTWAQILAEEPFEGEHWKGAYGLPAHAVVGGSDEDERADSDSSAAWSESSEEDERGEGDESEEEQRGGEGVGVNLDGEVEVEVAIPLRYDHRDRIEELKARQYWRPEWRPDLDLSRGFDIGDASTLGATAVRSASTRSFLSSSALIPTSQRYIYEHDAVREILMALQGRQNLLLVWTHQGFTPAPDAPRLAHLSLTAQRSLLASFARTASTLARLRTFAAPRHPALRTLEAFGAALAREVRVCDAWCAAREGAGGAASLLGLEKRLRDAFGGVYGVLLGVASRYASDGSEGEGGVGVPAVVAASLLDALLDAAGRYGAMGDVRVPRALLRVLARTAEPLWGMVGRWVRGGPGGLEEEFFVEDNEVGLGDAGFWEGGYTVRGRGRGVPVFLERVRDVVVSAGKSVGLLRAMGLDVEGDGGGRWRRFEELVGVEGEQGEGEGAAMSAEVLSQAVYDELLAPCRRAQTSLTRVLFGECELMRHLSAVENLYLMMQGDDMAHFSSALFGKASRGQPWTDFHFLNTSFSDVVDARAGKARWIDSTLVRLAYRGARATSRTVRVLDGLQVEYAVPFPLTYVFGPGALRSYNALFVFLLQLRRAKSVLDSILVRGAGAADELKVFYAIRSKLSWFVNTLLNFVATYVLHTQVLQLHGLVQKAESLDEIIHLHEDHLEKICSRCLLRENTAALHRAVLSVLDMSLYFSDCFVAFAGDNTHDISRASLIMTRRHRSRQQRRLRRNVIGFSQSLLPVDDDSDSDSDGEGETAPEPSFSVAASVSLAEEGFFERLDKMSSDLDGLVRFIRRGIESLAAGAGDSGQVFGVLAFSLEDWDR
ncbi:hypothetical protein NEOLEDRAFT_1056725 [Neolentinus lepideus HHB14362 ss-1]|uniref:Spindle pole body component n=1 Tax=Neolentinus lepideus HHB14362 ss-1 TaxID=1314782 RepID=A0A165V9N2_9AGAM|nr:hypothetical protein NEOLEDRAFT_1056725 [Neolentinus lepideus HHB14362 ss-1]